MATASRQWLQEELENEIIPLLAELAPDRSGKLRAKKLCTSLRDAWAARGLATPRQQQGCMDQVRAAIRAALGKQHWSLEFIKLSTEEHIEINHGKAQKVRERQLQQQYLKDPEAIVAQAVRLLTSDDWAEITAGLAVLTGRRLNELLETAEFVEVSQWVVRFEGALKRRDEAVPLVFEIPTLATARRVIRAIKRLRDLVPAGEMNESGAVAQASTRHFAALVPAPPGKSGLYAHLWRSVYACIATFWYCPKEVDEMLFKAHILGHFNMLSSEEQHNPNRLQQRLESFASDRHYRLYEVDDAVIAYYKGKRKGIKLGQAGVSVLPAFAAENRPAPVVKRALSTLKVYVEDKARLEEAYTRLGISPALSQHERFTTLLNWTLESLQDPQQQRQQNEELQGQEERQEVEPQQEAPAIPRSAIEQPTLPQDDLRTDIHLLVSTLQQLIAVQRQHYQPPTTMPQLAPVTTSQDDGSSRPAADFQERQEQQEQPRKARTAPQDNDRLVNAAIDAMIAYNNAAGRTLQEKWEISVNALKAYNFPQSAIYRVRNQRLEEINQHHEQHNIQPSHNLSHHRKQNPKEVIRMNEPAATSN